MIVGVGIDVVDVARFVETMERTPNLRDRLFTPAEAALSNQSLAARFAAKEAIAKALGAPPGLGWHDAEVVKEESGRPRFQVTGTVLAACEAAGFSSIHLSLSHDGGIATAYVVIEA